MIAPALSVRSFGATDVGRRRATNEDAFLVARAPNPAYGAFVMVT